MKRSNTGIVLLLLVIGGIAAIGGWMLATLGGSGPALPKKAVDAPSTSTTTVAATAADHPLAHIMDKDPLQSYLAAGNAQERMDMISNFMALGHESNYAMLKAALRDPDPENRIFAVESASALDIPEAVDVFKEGAASTDPDVREMTWSLSATYPMESRAAIYREALVRGNEQAFVEALDEMTVTPERPLFEMMLALGDALPSNRAQKILDTMKEWLEPGGGELPAFQSIADVIAWWERDQENYDEFLLRIDLEP